MNNHDKIELPPLPWKPAYEHHGSTLVVRLEDVEDAIRAAIEADRKRQGDAAQVLAELAALIPLADTLKASASCQDLIDYFKGVIADRKRRCEPVGWMYEDEIPDNYPYDAMFPYSKVEGVRMFPVYAPQPAEPVAPDGWKLVPETPTSKQIVHMALQIKGADADGWFRTDGDDWPECVDAAERAYKWALSEAPQPAEPVKTLVDNQEPLGEEFQRVLDEHSWDLYVKTAEPVNHSVQDCPEDDKWNCKYCTRVNSCPVQGHRDAQPVEPVKLCDCERGHNGMGMAGRECDCPAEPVKRKRRYAQGTALGEFGIIPMCDQVDDEPVKVLSDEEIVSLWVEQGGAVRRFARALLARYGKGTS